MAILITNELGNKFWKKDYGWQDHITQATLYEDYQRHHVMNVCRRITSDHAMVDDLERYDPTHLLYPSTDEIPQWWLSNSFYGWDERLLELSGKDLNSCQEIGDFIKERGLLDGLSYTDDHESSCCYWYFDSKEDAVAFTKRLKELLWVW